jgi:hypothetical protein
MDALDIGTRSNNLTSAGLVDITRILELTHLKKIAFWGNGEIFGDEAATHHFVSSLQQKMSSVEELPGLNLRGFRGAKFSRIVSKSLTRNQQLNRVHLLLAPPPPQQQQEQQQRGAAAIMMLKISH